MLNINDLSFCSTEIEEQQNLTGGLTTATTKAPKRMVDVGVGVKIGVNNAASFLPSYYTGYAVAAGISTNPNDSVTANANVYGYSG